MKFIRYFFVSGAAAALDFAVFALLTKDVHLAWFWSAVASFVLATLLNYPLSIRFVFQSGVRFSRKHHEVTLVFLVSLVGLAINQAVLWICIDRAHIDSLLAKVVGTGVFFFWSCFARRHFVFKPARVTT